MPSGAEFSLVALVFLLGGLGLLGKAIYLFRKSSEGIGLTLQDEVNLALAAKHKKLRDFPAEVAQMTQDFGAGVMLLAPFLELKNIDRDLIPPKLGIFLLGASAFAIGWLVRWLMRRTNPAV